MVLEKMLLLCHMGGGSANLINLESFQEYQNSDGNTNIKTCIEMKGLEVFVFILKNIPNMILKILR